MDTQLTKSEILTAFVGQERPTAIVQLLRLRHSGTEEVYTGPAQLFLQWNVPARGRAAPRLMLITVADRDWAEGSADDITEAGDVVVEDYLMRIFRVA
ncbi:hypothetical protein EKD04_024010 [Chloroflexales bacterium ZM16-3]|nr:hypothetical protein [Chloroflexales bacterium ZM16-3]